MLVLAGDGSPPVLDVDALAVAMVMAMAHLGTGRAPVPGRIDAVVSRGGRRSTSAAGIGRLGRREARNSAPAVRRSGRR
jgi:hypothetical protein